MSAIRCIAFVAAFAALALAEMSENSAMYSLSGLPGQISWPFNVKWRLVGNTQAAGGDFVAIRMYWKAGQYAAVGFSPVNMQGYITACNVPMMDPSSAVCTDVIGYNGGGITKNPSQYSRLLWAKVQDAGFVEAEIEVPLSMVNISYAADGTTRLIFASSTWNSTSNMPEPHNGQNRMPVHVNLAEGTVAAKSLPMATAASHTLQATSDFSAWWFIVYNTTMETSYTVFNIALSNAKRYGGIGIANAVGSESGGFACYYETTAMCVDVINNQKAPTTFTKILSSSKSGGVGYIAVQVQLPAKSAYPQRKTEFVSGKWDKTSNFPMAPDQLVTKYVSFNGDDLLASDYLPNTFELFPRYYANWAIAQTQSGFSRYSMRAYLEVAGDYFVGLGFANQSMGGPLVACHMPQSDALQVVCRDFIGQDGGGVVVNPEQSTKIVAAWAIEGGLTAYIVDIDLAKFNVSYVAAMTEYQRMIFAYGHWNSTTNMPTYHGPNATFFQVNIYTGAVNGTAPPTAPPAPTMAPMNPTVAPAMSTAAPTTKWSLQQKTCTGSQCKQGCTTNNLPTGECLSLNGGQGSAIATCHPNQGIVSLQIFESQQCTGMSQTRSMQLDQCGNDGSGYVEDSCVPASGAAMTEGAPVRPLKVKHSLNKF